MIMIITDDFEIFTSSLCFTLIFLWYIIIAKQFLMYDSPNF